MELVEIGIVENGNGGKWNSGGWRKMEIGNSNGGKWMDPLTI